MPQILFEKWLFVVALAGFLLFWVWESFAPFMAQRSRARHAARNLILAGANAIVLAVVFSAATVAIAEISVSRHWGLLYSVDFTALVRVALAFLLLDAWNYGWHWLNHRFPILWRFHQVHHSDPVMDVSTATRFHFGEIVISATLRLPLIPILGVPLEGLILYDAILLLATQFHHANLSLPARMDQLLRYGLVSPDMHKLHHSREKVETDSNYASVLSLWDRLFRTYREKTDNRSIRFGLDSFNGKRQSLASLWMAPFVGSNVAAPSVSQRQPARRKSRDLPSRCF